VSVVDELRKVPLFEGLSAKQLRRIGDMAKEMSWAPGENLTIENTKGSRFHLILDGKVDVSARGRRKTTLGPGDTLGEMALIDGQPRTATVVAATPVRTLSLASWNFKGLLREYPSIAEQVMRRLVQRIRELERSTVP
jgi:CRP-like cAMP-binding protein